MKYLQNKFAQKQALKGQQTDKAPVGIQDYSGGFQAQTGQGFQSGRSQGFSQTQQGDDPNRRAMRDDYGWKMTNAQYESMQADAAKFNRQLKQYGQTADKQVSAYKTTTQQQLADMRRQYDQRKIDLDKQLGTAKAQLSGARKELGSIPTMKGLYDQWFKEEKMPLRVVASGPKGDYVEATYYAPRTVLEKLLKDNPKLTAGFVDKGKNFNLHVKQGGEVTGQKMHDLATQLSDQKQLYEAFAGSKDVQGSYSKGVSQWKSADARLREAEASYNQQATASRSALSQYNIDIKKAAIKRDEQIKRAYQSRDAEIGKAKAGRQGQIDAAKKAYEARAERAKKAYQNLKGMRNE